MSPYYLLIFSSFTHSIRGTLAFLLSLNAWDIIPLYISCTASLFLILFSQMSVANLFNSFKSFLKDISVRSPLLLLSRFSRVWLCATQWTVARQTPPSMGILQARILEWVAISFSNAWKWKVKVRSLSRVWPFATPWTAAYQAPLSMDFSGKSTGVGCHCLLRRSPLQPYIRLQPCADSWSLFLCSIIFLFLSTTYLFTYCHSINFFFY